MESGAAFNKMTSTDAAISPFLVEIFREHGLTEREIEVANLIVIEGLDNKEISNRIFRSVVTVKNHATHIYRKFNVKKRAELMALVVRKYCVPG